LDDINQLFVAREVLLRTDGRVKYITLTRRQQIAAASLATVVIGWTFATSIGFAVSTYLLSDRSVQMKQATAAYDELRRQVAASRARFAELAQALSANQKFMLDLVRDHREAAEARAPLPAAFVGNGPVADDPAGVVQVAVSDGAARVAEIVANNRLIEQEVLGIRTHMAELDEARARTAAERDRATGRLRDAEARLAAQQSAEGMLAKKVAELQARIDGLDVAQADGAAARQALDRRIAALTDRLASSATENRLLQQTIGAMQRTTASIADDRSALRAARDELSSQVAVLENRMSAMQTTQQNFVQQLAERTRGNLAEVEKTVLMTGLDIESLLGAAAAKLSGQGGPFIPAVRQLRSAEERKVLASIQKLDGEVDRWERLQLVLRSLPLAAPLDNYVLESGFGERADPINHRHALHEGLDLKNDIGTPVLSTAPGTVVYAGWMGDYGRVVEIDHGLGIRTRYAHLKAISVKVGQTVDFRQEVGKLGNSGRTTGPHVHYEVRVNGKPYDPMNFMEAGKYVFKG
jgi:murein DD-endopeptidase MepM/ murein hydrolase activator NlpD